MRRWLAILGTLCVLAVLGAVGAGYAAYTQYFQKPGPLTTPTTLVIERGMGIRSISLQLAEKRIIEWPMLFAGIARALQSRGSIQAGEYAFSPAMSPEEILIKLWAGDVVVHKLTIPEGLTSPEILALLRDTPGLTGDMPTHLPTGTLLPETYYYRLGETRATVLKRMETSLQHWLKAAWEKRTPHPLIHTPEQAITLASIVEKETGLASERPRVARVFFNRLERGMRLQSDPTVIFALTEGQTRLDRPLTRTDLTMPSPYNTYTTGGLPPSPIANPGKASLEAVLHPVPGEELYFVADGKGGHRFASTLAEHNANVAAYRNVLRAAETKKPSF
jgi:UPF0755 protein